MRNAFQSIKDHLGKAPHLTNLSVNEVLYLYLVSIKRVVASATLMVDKEGRKQLVYYVSHSLIRAQQRYPSKDKAAFTIRMVSKNLKQYFSTYKIVVLTSQPLKNIIGKSEQSSTYMK